MRVLHVLANSSPDVNGYAVRTQMILQNQPQDVVGLTSPWYPQRETMIDNFTNNGVEYLRTVHPLHSKNKLSFGLNLVKRQAIKDSGKQKHENDIISDSKPSFVGKLFRAPGYFTKLAWKILEEKILMRYFMQRIIEVAKQEKAELIHAHTPYRVGLPALKAARKLRLPFVYEMRGIWEETAVANGRWRANGPAYRRFQRFENKVLRAADSVVCISETLKHEAISRGIDAAKITVVTNAAQIIDDSDLQKHETFDRVVASLGIKPSTRVIGYIGSLREMEGVDLTAEAVAELMKQGFDVRFFVLSGTAGQEELRDLCDRLELGDSAVITGPVPHQFVPQFYELIDIFVVSRPDAAVTRLVTPLKPFEAMAMKRAVVTSNLDALQEIVTDNETGLLFQAGNLSSLVETIERLVTDEKSISRLGNNAYDWIIHNRTWELVVKNYAVAYQIAVEKRG
ncbi:MAG: glycosyltransferase [Candidatus Thermoplasmatota archaeon]|nr:glycosyltransferase [Candidatus Thermoplasmatota archaeon]